MIKDRKRSTDEFILKQRSIRSSLNTMIRHNFPLATKAFLLLLTFILLRPSPSTAQDSSAVSSTTSISLEEKIGQMIMVGIRGAHLNSEAMSTTKNQIENGEIGGIIFFKHNIKNSRQFRIFVKRIANLKTGVPLLLSVDEEGGRVRRLKQVQGFEEFPSAAHVGNKLSLEEAYDLYKRMAIQIHETGLNLNLAPVVDVNINRASPAIGQLNRSFSRDPGQVFEMSDTFIRAHHDANVLTAIKHYPGHGSSREDTHHQLTDISHTWRSSEQIPFKRLIDSAVVDIIMAGHLFDRSIDKEFPASISKAHIQQNLRDKLGYEGVVLTDDLQMGAIIDRYSLDDIIITAVNAGCDIIQFSDPLDLDRDLPRRIRRVILEAIAEGKIDENRIHESYDRIILLKQSLMKSKAE